MFIIWQGGSRFAKSDLSHSSRRDTWCAIRLFAFSPIVTLKSKDQLLPIHEPRNTEIAFEDRHRVTTHSHLGAMERAAQRAEAQGLAAKEITVFSRCQFNLISTLIPARSK
jgi:hypothetical protein